MQSERQKLIAALRHIADVLEDNPLVPEPYVGTGILRVKDLSQMMAVGKAFGGYWDKSADDENFRLTREFTDDFRLMLFINRENVCQRVVVGTKVVPATTLPAREEVHMPERIEEVVEWHCPPSLQALVRNLPPADDQMEAPNV